MIDLTHSVSIAQDHVVRLLRAFLMSSIISLDHEIMQLPNTGGTLSVLSNITT